MKNFRNNSWPFLLLVCFLIGVSFVDQSRPAFRYYDYASGADTSRQPIMVVSDTTVGPMTLLVIRDTATAMENIGPTLGRLYGEIGGFMAANGLQFGGHPMAFYYTEQAPFVLEAAVPVDKKPGTGNNRIWVREISKSKAVVVHFWGPYELTVQAGPKINEWLKKNNKKAKGPALDVYITDPTTVNDPYKVQTDIIQIYQ